MARIQSHRMIKPRAIDRRRFTGVFSGAEDHDRVRRPGFIRASLMRHAPVLHKKIRSDHDKEVPDPSMRGLVVGRSGGGQLHPWEARYSTMSCSLMAPSRCKCHSPDSSERSMMVEATSRGDVPPSTMMGIAFPSCSRTPSAVVHSLAPLTLAEVAVMGIPAAFITAIGILAAGTRSATLPEFAVTFSGNRDAARTMMVSGPGQYFLDSR